MPKGRKSGTFTLNASAAGYANPGYQGNTKSATPHDKSSEYKPKATTASAPRLTPYVRHDGGVSKIKGSIPETEIKAKAPAARPTSGRYIIDKLQTSRTLDKPDTSEKSPEETNNDWVVPPSYSTEAGIKLAQSFGDSHTQESSTEEKDDVLEQKARQSMDKSKAVDIQETDAPIESSSGKTRTEDSVNQDDSKKEQSEKDDVKTTVKDPPRVILRIREEKSDKGSIGNGSVHSNHTGSENGSIPRDRSDSESEVKLDNLQADLVKELTVNHDDLGAFVRTPSGRRVTFDKSRILYTTSKSGSNIIIDALPSDTESEVSGNRSHSNGSVIDPDELYEIRQRQWLTMDWAKPREKKQKSCPFWLFCTVFVISLMAIGILGALYGLQFISTHKGEIKVLEESLDLHRTQSGELFKSSSYGPTNKTRGGLSYVLVQGREVMPWKSPSMDVTIVWNRGSPIEILTLSTNGLKTSFLGDPIQDSDYVFSKVIRSLRGEWTAAHLVNPDTYSLFSYFTIDDENPLWTEANATALSERFPNDQKRIFDYT